MITKKFFRSNIINFWTKFDSKLDCRLKPQLYLIYIFLLDVNCEKFTIGLYFFLISSILAKFQENKKSIVLSSIKSLNFEFLYSKIT